MNLFSLTTANQFEIVMNASHVPKFSLAVIEMLCPHEDFILLVFTLFSYNQYLDQHCQNKQKVEF